MSYLPNNLQAKINTIFEQQTSERRQLSICTRTFMYTRTSIHTTHTHSHTHILPQLRAHRMQHDTQVKESCYGKGCQPLFPVHCIGHAVRTAFFPPSMTSDYPLLSLYDHVQCPIPSPPPISAPC